jgi:hypothetical protein
MIIIIIIIIIFRQEILINNKITINIMNMKRHMLILFFISMLIGRGKKN